MVIIRLFGALLFVLYYSYTACTQGNSVQKIRFDNDGFLTQESQLPACDSGVIKLLSYNYLFECRSGYPCPYTPKTKLSHSEEEMIHDMCSMKQRCIVPKSHIIVTAHTNFEIELEYDCLDIFANFVNICQNMTIASLASINLVNKGNAHTFENCQCSIEGQFQLTLADVRLQSANGDHCSPAKLQAHFKTYQCEGMRSVFNRTISDTLTNEMILFTANSTTEDPEMVYLTVKPQGQQVTVSCMNKPIIISQTTTETPQPTKVTTEMYIYDQSQKKSSSSASMSVAMVAMGAVATLVLVVVVVVVRRRRKRQREKRRRLKHLEMLVENQLNQRRSEQQQGNQNPGMYSFATEDKFCTGVMDEYVDLVRNQTAGSSNCDVGGHHQSKRECDMKKTTAQTDSNHVSANKTRSKFGRLKKGLNRAPKQEASVYSYATHEPLLRPTEGTADKAIAYNDTSQSLITSTDQKEHFYVKLEPHQVSKTDSIESIHNEHLDISGNVDATSSGNVSLKKKKNFKIKRKDAYSNSRGGDSTKVYDAAYYAIPLVDVAQHDSIQSQYASPSMPQKNGSEHETNHKQLCKYEISTNASGANKYETIDMSRSTDSHSSCQKESKSPGIMKKIVNKVTKGSKPKLNNETTEVVTPKSEENENESILPVKDLISSKSKIDDLNTLPIKTSDDHYDSACVHENVGHGDPRYDHLVSPKVSKTKSFFGKINHFSKTKLPTSMNAGTNEEGIQSSATCVMKEETKPIIFKSKQEENTTSDDDHYDKLTIDENVGPNHPNYDKLSKAKHFTLKSAFHKQSKKSGI